MTQRLTFDILDSSASLIFATGADLNCAYMNTAMRDVLGLASSAKDETLDLFALLRRDRAWFDTQIRTVAVSGAAHVELEITADGEARAPYFFTIRPMSKSDGEAHGFVFMSVDPGALAAIEAESMKVAALANRDIEREHRNALEARVSSCVAYLRNCNSLSETYEIVFRSVREIFDDARVELFVADTEAEMLELQWSSGDTSGVVVPYDDCGAMRSRQLHSWWRDSAQMRCAHDTEDHESVRFCAPILAYDGPFAIMSLMFNDINQLSPRQRDASIAARRQRIREVAARLSLALSNVDLRVRLERAALTDPLTSTFNRRAFERSVVRAIARTRRHKLQFGFVVIDIDHFKDLNDKHGHDAGDKMLTRLSTLLTRQTRTSDTIARLGGTEFGVLLEGASEDETILKAEELRKAIAAESFLAEMTMTASLGVTHSGGFEQLNWKELYGAATRALYIAKSKGRNCVMLGGSGG